MSIREIKVRKAAYEWTTFMVQGFKDAGGKWARKKFKTRAAAEAFVAMKSLENVTPDMPQRPVITTLSEAVIDRHYLNLPTPKEGKAFFGILPADADRKIVPMRRERRA